MTWLDDTDMCNSSAARNTGSLDMYINEFLGDGTKA